MSSFTIGFLSENSGRFDRTLSFRLNSNTDRGDGSHQDLDYLIGAIVYQKSPQDLSGKALADHEIIQIKVKLSAKEQEKYKKQLKFAMIF